MYFHSPCEKRFRQSRFRNFIVHSRTPRGAKLPFIHRWLPWSCWKCKTCARTIIRVVNLLIVDVHFNIGKKSVQNVFYKSNEKNWSFLRRLLFFRFCRFFVLLFLLPCYCKIHNHHPWQISIQKTNSSVSNQRTRFYLLENQTLCGFHRVRY